MIVREERIGDCRLIQGDCLEVMGEKSLRAAGLYRYQAERRLRRPFVQRLNDQNFLAVMEDEMPIRAENRKRYPKNWREISLSVREAAGWRCEGSPDYPDCRAENGKPHPVTGSRVVLTVAHLDHTPENCERDNLKAWCQRCHLNYDRHMHAANRRKTLSQMGDLFEAQP